MAKFSQPRALKPNERALMELLFTADFAGRTELKGQLDQAEVVGNCDCGCGTIDFSVKQPFVRAIAREPIPVEAHGTGVDVLLFVRDGILSSLEIVDHG